MPGTFKKLDASFSHLFLRLSDKTECSSGAKECTELRGYLVKKIGGKSGNFVNKSSKVK